jgi:membrane protein YqaA with SNARE-associated domain
MWNLMQYVSGFVVLASVAGMLCSFVIEIAPSLVLHNTIQSTELNPWDTVYGLMPIDVLFITTLASWLPLCSEVLCILSWLAITS